MAISMPLARGSIGPKPAVQVEILVLDDDAEVLEIASGDLAEGYRISTATNSADALQALDEHPGQRASFH
jgi:CheY-like chemotaxis protein